MALINARMQQRRRATAANLASENPLLAAGEFCTALDVPLLKVGPGLWNDLPDILGPEIAVSDPAKVPVNTVGVTTTLDVTEVAWRPLFARLTADSTPVNNSTVLVNATGLVLALAANCTYVITGTIFYISGATGRLALAWTAPAGVTGSWAPMGPTTGAFATTDASFKFQDRTWAETTTMGMGTTPQDLFCTPRGVIVTVGTAGNLQLQFAQTNVEVVNTIIRAQSFIMAQRVA